MNAARGILVALAVSIPLDTALVALVLWIAR